MTHPIRHRKGLILSACCAVLILPASDRGVRSAGTFVAPVETGGSAVAPSRMIGQTPENENTPARLGERVARLRRVRGVLPFGSLPLNFEANIGQVKQGSNAVQFLSRGAGYTLFLTSDGAVLALGGRQESVLHMKLEGANPRAKVTGAEALPGKSNYLIGNDPRKWRASVPTFAKVQYRNVYPGVDLVYYGNQGQLEYDFVVAPGADPRAITLDVEGVRESPQRAHRDAPLRPDARLRIDARGDLVIGARGGEVRFQKPVVYQPVAAMTRKSVEGRYVLKGKHGVGFEIAAYDPTRPLVIDPVLSYSTYLGGTSGADYGQAIALDPAGNAYVTGYTCSTDFPTLDPVQSLNASGGCEDAFVAKLDAAGDALVYSTFLGGTGNDAGLGIAVDPAGGAYVAGYTCSTDFPVVNAIQATSNGDCDAFVSKLNSAGNELVYSTYLGGSDTDVAQAISADPAGNAYVTGYTLSADFPTTAGAFQTTFGGGSCGAAPQEAKPCADAFVAKLNPTGSALAYSTYLGGGSYDAGQGIAVDGAGNAYVTGFTTSSNFPAANALQPGCDNCGFPGEAGAQGLSSDAFVTKLNPAGSALVYSTYLGGSGADTGTGIAVDPPGNAYVTGYTASKDFPTLNPLQANAAGGYDAFVTKLKADGSALVYSTYLGGSGNDLGFAIAVDSAGSATIAGETFSEDFPVGDAFQPRHDGGFDAFVSRLNAAGDAAVYSSYLGGGSGDQALGVALDSSGSAYVVGITNSADFPTTSVAFQTTCEGGSACAEAGAKAYVVKIENLDLPAVALSTLNLALGNETVGKAGPPVAVTLRNVGSQPLAIRKIFTASRRYFTQSNDCGAELAPGESCTINVTFTPVVTGQVTGFLVITDNAWPKGLQLIRLVGRGN